LTRWPWKSIGFQILLRTKNVPSLVKIHWRMLILECTQGCYVVNIWRGDNKAVMIWSVFHCKLLHLNLLLWNHWTKLNPFQNCVRQPCTPFKMAAVAKNRNYFNCNYLAMSSLTYILWNFSFSQYITIMQIRHILIKDHI
jgi:hypothetical protein